MPARVNKNLSTGEIEVVADELRLLNDCKPLPFTPADTVLANEEVRLKYRYVDLRRPEMQRNIQLRHKVAIAIRDYLNAQGFYEIETPFMTRSTPEGARDYLVPSRVYPGEFYALPQSPQLFKQILMISGFDRYFQIVRCFRDEDLRADRQPEFTQIDLEISFRAAGDRLPHVVEGFLKAAFATIGADLHTPFPQMSYDQAIRLYGIDKPDLRLPCMADVRHAFAPENLETLHVDPELARGGHRHSESRRALAQGARRDQDACSAIARTRRSSRYQAPGEIFPDAVAKIRELAKPNADDLLVVVARRKRTERQMRVKRAPSRLTRSTLLRDNCASHLGQKYAERHGAYKHGNFRFLWVTDFPMFEWDETEQRWNAAHHPFTSPHDEDMDKLESDPGAVRALAYDVVLNGTELGSGSIRIHRQDIQAKIFNALGMSPEEQQARFGFFLEALQYGTPPHGGIALGLDRIVMILAGAESLREVIPFPKTAKAVDLMVDAPTPVSERQLKELGIAVVGKKE